LQIGFLTEWQYYAQALEGDEWKGELFDRAKIDKMSGMSKLRYCKLWITNVQLDQQIGQLYELMQAIRKKELEDNDPESKPEQ
jgi:hypothetical protein